MSTPALGIATMFAADATELANSLRHTVVEVRTGGGSGAGIVWGDHGLVVTNAHCAPQGASVRVDAAGRDLPARVIAYSRDHDLALLTVPLAAPPLELRDADSLCIGELAFAHGHPLGMRDSLAMGVIHGIARSQRTGEPRFVIADVRLAPGNSGGPLVDAAGRLIGVNSMVINGLGVAVPARAVARFVQRAAAMRAA